MSVRLSVRLSHDGIFCRNSSTYHQTFSPSWSKSEVKFQYGGRLYFETGSSYISAAIWDISTKFGLLIDFNLLKAVTLTDTKPEVVFSRRGRHLDKAIWRYISAVDDPIWTKFGRMMHNNMQITPNWSRSKSEVKFQYGGRSYFETGSSIQPSRPPSW